MGDIRPCFNVATPLKSRHHSVGLFAPRSTFVSEAHQATRPSRKQNPSTVIRASASQDDQSEQYKEFAKFLGDPDPDFLRKGKKHEEADAIEEQAAAKSKAEIAKDYQEMAELLGPPAGRFGAKSSTPKAKSVASDSQIDETTSAETVDEANAMPPEPPVRIDRFVTPIDATAGYEEMADMLGPPSGRFRGISPEPKNTAAPFEKPDEVVIEFAKTVPDPSSEPDLCCDEPRDPKAYWKEALSREEEYALFENLLRKTGGQGNKPRKGGRQHVTWAEKVEGIVRDPWSTDFNLSPKKGKPKVKGSPPPKGTPPFKFPDEIKMTTQQIEQSYWTLEKLLDDEEDDWQEEQAKKKAEKEKKLKEKQERKAKAKLLKKPAHPDDRPLRPPPVTGGEEADASPVVEKKPRSVLRGPPKRAGETDVAQARREKSPVKDVKEVEVKPTPVLQQPPKRTTADSENEGVDGRAQVQSKKSPIEKLANVDVRPTPTLQQPPMRTVGDSIDAAGPNPSLDVSSVLDSEVEVATPSVLETPPKRGTETEDQNVSAVVASNSDGFFEASVDGKSVPTLEKPHPRAPPRTENRAEERKDAEVFYLEDPKLLYFLDDEVSEQ